MRYLDQLATKADLGDARASIIRWAAGTLMATAALAFVVAKFLG